MTSVFPRVAYFPDSFHEVNGVAHTSRHFEAFSRRHQRAFLCVRAGTRAVRVHTEGPITTLELPRGFSSFALDKDLRFDPLYFRHSVAILDALRAFRPDVLHITGPSELGILGAIFAHRLKIPLAASWHTNVHEYAGRRSASLLRWLPGDRAANVEQRIEDSSLWATGRFYRLARVLFAPNVELCALLESVTGRPCALMPRGVDTELFSPQHRQRAEGDGTFVLGFVGRLSVEKNVALLVSLDRALKAAGIHEHRFLIIGQGAEEQSLREQLPDAIFAGVLRGAELSRAYASMDCFVFPSHTDTFGNVVLEALASGVPAVVTPDGGPKFIVQDGETGFVATDADFPVAVARLIREPKVHRAMCEKARVHALASGWDAVFERVYVAYGTIFAENRRQ